MEVQRLQLAPRGVTGKKVAALRRQGIVPVHVYGVDRPPQALQVTAQVLYKVLSTIGMSVPLTVAVDGQDGDDICFVREVQRHPVTSALLHVDFMRVDASRSMTAEVPLHLVGTAPAVQLLGGTMVQALQTLLVEALPLEMLAFIAVDVSGLGDFEKTIHVGDVSVPPRITVLTPRDEMVCRVFAPRLAEEPGAVGEAAPQAAEAEETAPRGAATG